MSGHLRQLADSANERVVRPRIEETPCSVGTAHASRSPFTQHPRLTAGNPKTSLQSLSGRPPGRR